MSSQPVNKTVFACDIGEKAGDRTMVTLMLPIRIVSVANLREHWSVRSRRSRDHRMAALAIPSGLRLPVTVFLTRIAPRPLDSHDNLRSGFKALVDGISDRLGVKDNDPHVRWEYQQLKGKPKQYAVNVTIREEQRDV